ncbi:inhibitor of growth protein 3 [Contarinia nasturtii]|uniref:inhibitor of growth protein 3 n=1 Tax=Contarinia nasturtii TaxID=265458 RepID=UPI0012D47F03|nr:inhibitor of growth protein 3 [Contarinia nasturtii]
MLYLEDYLEMIEHLPQELRDRFTDMREMDLTVQNHIDEIEKRIRGLFSRCARGELQGTQADDEYNEISKDYYKILEDADEKVALASLMYDLVDRYLRRLDSELFKFKCELEADHNGITEILEKRSLELEGNSSSSNSNINSNNILSNSTSNASNSQKENRFFGAISSNMNTPQNREKYKARPEKRRNSSTSAAVGPIEKRPALSTPVSNVATTPNNTAHSSSSSLILPANTPTLQTSVPYNLQHIGAGNAIAAAASQAIVATQQMQQGRRTASLKASYEAIHGSSTSGSHELLIGRELAGAAHNALQAVEREGNTLNNRRQKKKVPGLNIPTNGTPPLPVSLSLNANVSHTPTPSILTSTTDPESPSAAMLLGDNGLVVDPTTDGDWSYDPNEPRYCVCNQVSYGDMVACDNEACPFEWFHYPCVGITQPPKGKWYCPKCTASMKRRGIRK